MNKKIFINFLKSQGIQVKTDTKARGHQGIFFKNRIDISKKLDEKRSIEVMAHEFAHFIHSKIEPDIFKTGGHLDKLFLTDDISLITKELILLTEKIDKNSLCLILNSHKSKLQQEIKMLQKIIQEEYPQFKKSKKFIEFDRFIRLSKAKYLLKYDIVKYVTPFLKQTEIYSIDNLEKDFPQMKKSFVAYIRLKSKQRKCSRITRRISKLRKYYLQPSELFARFIEGFFVNENVVITTAPKTYETFSLLLKNGMYHELREFLDLRFS